MARLGASRRFRVSFACSRDLSQRVHFLGAPGAPGRVLQEAFWRTAPSRAPRLTPAPRARKCARRPRAGHPWPRQRAATCESLDRGRVAASTSSDTCCLSQCLQNVVFSLCNCCFKSLRAFFFFLSFFFRDFEVVYASYGRGVSLLPSRLGRLMALRWAGQGPGRRDSQSTQMSPGVGLRGVRLGTASRKGRQQRRRPSGGARRQRRGAQWTQRALWLLSLESQRPTEAP